MSNNENTPCQSTDGPSHSRRPLHPVSATNPSMRDNQFNPLVVNPSSSPSPLVPPVPLSQGEPHQPVLPASAAPQLSIRHLEPWRASSSNPSLKRDFASAFEGFDFASILRQSVERARDTQADWIPDIPKDARKRFLMQQSPEDFEYQCRMFAVRAKWSYDAMIDNDIRAIQAEEQNHVLRNQFDTILAAYRRNAGEQNHVLCYRLGRAQASLENERRLREQADQSRKASAERVRELEGKLAAVMQELEQKRADIDHMLKVNTPLQADVDGDFEHPLRE